MSTPSDTAAAIDRLEARLARMEGAIERLTSMLDAAGLGTTGDSEPQSEARRAALAETAAVVTEPEVMQSLGHIAAQAPRLTAAVDLAAGLEDYVATALRVGDDLAEGLGGATVEHRLQAGREALQRLSEPATLDALGHMAEQAPRLTAVVDLAAGFEDYASSALGLGDELAEGLGGAELEARLQAGRTVLRELTAPDTLTAIGHMAEQAPRLTAAVDLVAGLEDHVAGALELGDGLAERLGDVGLEQRVQGAAELLARLSEPEVVSTIVRLVERAPQLEAVLQVLDQGGPEDSRPLGLWGLYRALGEPDVQRALGVTLSMARQLGRAQSSAGVVPRG